MVSWCKSSPTKNSEILADAVRRDCICVREPNDRSYGPLKREVRSKGELGTANLLAEVGR